MPKAQRDKIEHTEEIIGFLHQSNISARNLARLDILAESPIATVSELACVVREVAGVRPGKRKRTGFLARNHRSLLAKLAKLGLVMWYEDEPASDELSVGEMDFRVTDGASVDDDIPF